MAYGVGIAVAGVFAALSILHVYWALGGTIGLEAAIPERPTTPGDHANIRTLAKAFHPTAIMTLPVAGALATAGALLSLRAGLFRILRKIHVKNMPQLVDVVIRTRAYDPHCPAPARYFSDFIG